ncbi:reticulon-like protein B21 [Neltuma alba]|uniref:reticulon-like protein B21 n=1 Tax=Neltuma alba TaxID=207710 RepID=UPI0010A4E7FB|nr:reticulon-like protein B21 [Prosopis alba]
MDVGRRRGGGARSSVVPGSVWESRMKSDEVKGGIKVFNGEESPEEGGDGRSRLRRISNGKRKTWKSESSEGFDRNLIHVARRRSSETLKNCDELSKGLSVSLDGIKKTPILTRKISSSAEKIEGSPILMRKLRSTSAEEPETNSKQLKKSKSESVNQNVEDVDGLGNGDAENSIVPRKAKLVPDEVLDESKNKTNGVCKDFGLCQEKSISSRSVNVGRVKNPPELPVKVDGDIIPDIDDEADERVEIDEEMKMEKENVKEINVSELKTVNEPQHKKVLIQRRFQHDERPVSILRTARQSSPIKRHSTIYDNFRKSHSIPTAEKHHSFPHTQNKLQSLVDLIMWREVSRSAFVFGTGTFIIISSSYPKDINVSSISVMSYLGLAHLAVIFLYRSFICRGVINFDRTNHVLGEEEAIWVIKLILPYLNEFLLKLRALFSGDPGTTMKMAVLLFVLARWGSSITIWKMAKFGFFVVFMAPKLYSLYSAQLASYANSWVKRVREGWDSCSHKKAAGIGIFGLVWNLSSVVVRIWAVFLLIVALRYYQENQMGRDEWGEEEEEEAACEEEVGVGGHGPTFLQTNKPKKAF